MLSYGCFRNLQKLDRIIAGGEVMGEGLSKKEKRLMDMDNSEVIAEGEWGITRLNGNKKYNKNC